MPIGLDNKGMLSFTAPIVVNPPPHTPSLLAPPAGPYLVFLCSTVNGYEGTGRSLSLKLIQQLREQGAKLPAPGSAATSGGGATGVRTLREVTLQEPIRWAHRI